uniref:serine carboxypeptidase-like 13 n=1 Tax=Erigeron canadensis TaxID=72917 RepID=UPI001CB94348|nr:serine carboxypeptidase-like 13 [Erigeron canadensis]
MYKVFLLILVIIVSCSSSTQQLGAYSQTIVETLPGYPGSLPFKLETGYIGVGDDEAVQLFYLFVESEGNPDEDPLIIWLAGGPGCSNLHAFFFEIGPLKIQNGKYIDNVPALQLDPNSWTKLANVIYLDAPTLTGYSYTTTPEAARTSDTLSASQTTQFIRKFVSNHQKFLKNPMYVTGISYSGIVIPIITEMLYKGNEQGLEPLINIKGYIAGNPLTDHSVDINSRFEFAYQMSLISKALFESVNKNCNGNYVEAYDQNILCKSDIDEINDRVKHINISQVLEPDCERTTNLLNSVNPTTRRRGNIQRSAIWENPIKMVPAKSSLNDTICQVNYYYATLWANNRNVMKALNVRKARRKEHNLCNMDMYYYSGYTSLSLYDFDVLSSVIYHQQLSMRKCRALIFSGDHDMQVPHIGTSNWINSLNLEITTSNWDAWYSNDQVAGFKTTYAYNNYSLDFATVKGGGHTVPEFKPKECFDMVKRWFAHKPI